MIFAIQCFTIVRLGLSMIIQRLATALVEFRLRVVFRISFGIVITPEIAQSTLTKEPQFLNQLFDPY